MSGCLLIRADASTSIGTGHVARCLALAQGRRRSGGSAFVASAETTDALEKRVANEGFQSARLSVVPGTIEDALKTVEIAKGQNASWIVADGYCFGLGYQSVIKASGLQLLLLDDYGHSESYVADFVLNQNLAADPELYVRRAPYTGLLLGTRYALLRNEFLSWHGWNRKIPKVAFKVLVTLGGSDPENISARVVEALQGLDVEARIIVGGSNPHFDCLLSAVRPPSSVIRDATNMAELMAWADIAIAAGGTTSWELAFMGLPSLVFVLAENQADIVAALEREKVAVSLGWHDKAPKEKIHSVLAQFLNESRLRREMSLRGRRLVDGRGVDRVIASMSGSNR